MRVEINPAYQTHIQTYLDRATAAHAHAHAEALYQVALVFAEVAAQVAARNAQRPERNEGPALPPDPAP
jgi:hypothetical protein